MAISEDSSPQREDDDEEEEQQQQEDDDDDYDDDDADDVHGEEDEEEENGDDDDSYDDDQDEAPFDIKDSAEFSVALQELKSIRSHLYSAAEYCESAYIYSDQKQAIFENLKDYSVKALVNAVDHVGTVASKLNDLLSKRTKEMSVVELHVSCLSQRLQTYHDRTNWEGLNHYQHVKRRPRYGQHYALAENMAGDSPNYGDKHWIIVRKVSQTGQYQDDVASESNVPKSLAWHLSSETPSVSSTTSTPTAPHVNRSTSSNFRGDKKAQGFLSRSLSGGQFSLPRNSPNLNTFNKIHEPVQSPGSSKSLSSLLSLDETKRHGLQSHKKGLLSTFLGRTKSGKPKRLSTLTSFKQ